MFDHVGVKGKRKLVLVVLPMLALLALVINPHWDIPHQDLLVGVIIGVGAFLSALWGSESHQKKHGTGSFEIDGYVHSDSRHEDSGLPNLQMTLVRDPNDLLQKDHLTFKVGRPPQNS